MSETVGKRAGASGIMGVAESARDAGVAYFGKQDSGRRPGIELPGELGERAWPHGD